MKNVIPGIITCISNSLRQAAFPRPIWCLVCATLTLSSGITAKATTWYVDASQADDSGAATNWTTAKRTIQAAVDLATVGDTVLVTNGVYDSGGAVTPGYTLTSRVCITNTISVQSVNGPAVATIEGTAACRGAFLANGAQLVGFTVCNGYTLKTDDYYYDRCGGGVWMMTNCVASNLIVQGNTAYGEGGGVYCYEGGTLNNSLLSGNWSEMGGGGAGLYYGGTLNSCTLSNNTTQCDGGGVYFDSYYEIRGTANNCLLIDNSATTNGGGASCVKGGVLNNCLVRNNSSVYGGGVATSLDGALNNCTVISNSASTCGGGAYLDDGGTLNNCIFYWNTGSSGNDIYNNGADAIRYTRASDGVTNGASGCITNDPQFVNAASGDYQLQNGSPCVNAGDNPYAPTNETPYDLAGNTRIIYGIVDMGAYENQTRPDVAYVDASIASSGAGTNWTTAYKTIQEGVDAVTSTGTVWVTNGVYDVGGRVAGSSVLTNRVCITNDIAVSSMNGAAYTIIIGAAGSAGNSLGPDAVRGIYMSTGTLSGFTITNGYTLAADDSHNGIHGGGIFVDGGGKVEDCVIRNCGSLVNGGGMYLCAGGSATRVLLENSEANYGGGACLETNSVLSDALVVNNDARVEGGGVFTWFAGPQVVNCTISDNEAVGSGDGIFIYQGGALYNSIVYGNASDNIYVNTSSDVLYTCSPGLSGSGNLDADPLFVGGGDYTLQADSPCISAGDNTLAQTNNFPTDLSGNPRVIGSTVDMGAYEHLLSRLEVSPLSLSFSTTYATNPASQSLTLSNAGPVELAYEFSMDYGSGASGWLSPDPASGTLATGADQEQTINVDVSGVDAGTHYATGTFVTVTISNTVSPVSFELTISKADQSISFPNPGTQMTTNITVLSATASSGLDVEYSVVSGPASISGGTNVIYSGTGTVVLAASQSGDANWNAAVIVTNTYEVNITPQQIQDFTPVSGGAYAATQAVTMAATASSGLSVTFAVQSGPAVVYDGNSLRFTGAGTVVFSANQAGNAIWEAAASLYHTSTVTDATFSHYVAQAGQIPYPPYASWESAASNIQDAVDLAVDGDTVFVSNGVYNSGGRAMPISDAITNRVCITNAITVQSMNGPEVTSIEGASDSGGCGPAAIRGVFMTNSCSLIGFTVTNGYTHSEWYSYYERCGGGIRMTTNCLGSNLIVRGNTSDQVGGGVYLEGGGTLNNCTLSDNSADWGGGAEIEGGTLNDCIITKNSASWSGGGVEFEDDGTLNNCTLSENSADYDGGGARFSWYGTLNNCLLVGNSAWSGGGAEIEYGGIMNNCTVTDNSADYGGGVDVEYDGIVNNCIIYGNTTTNLGNDIYRSGTSTTVRSTCASDGVTNGVNGCITNDPRFVCTSAGVYQLLEGSPCVNTGDNTYAPTNATPYDLVGNPRIMFGTVDMGAYELRYIGVLSTNTSPPAGGGTLIVSNMLLGGGSDITNVTVVGIAATIIDQGSNWVQVTLGASADPYQSFAGDVLIQSVSVGETLLEDVFAYLRGVNMPFYVDDSRPDDSGDGKSWAAAFKTIQAGVDAASYNDVVWVTNGVYDTGSTVTPGYILSNRVCITKPITVRSVNGPEVTVIAGASDGGNLGYAAIRGVFMSNGCSLVGFAVTNGCTTDWDGEYEFDQCGGGLWLTTGCTASNMIVQANMGGDGGGVHLYLGGTLNNCTLRGNTSEDWGAGVFLNEGGTLNSCVLSNNHASGEGGAAYVDEAGTLNNCTLTGNTANNDAGGVALDCGGTLNNCTLSGNSANRGGGVYLYDGGTLNNCICYGNTGDSGNDINYYESGTFRTTCASDGIVDGVNGCITSDPLFVDAASGNYQLQNCSPCIDMGDNTYAPTNVTPYDLAGNPRIVHDNVDMGAYENQLMYTFSTRSSPAAGGGTLVISNGVLGSSDITNVTMCGILATIADQGSDWVQVTLGASSDNYQMFIGDVLIQSVTSGDTLIQNAFVYLRDPNLPFYVDASKSDDAGDGRSWATAKKTIQAAVNLAADSDVVWVTNGVYDTGGTVTPGYALTNRVCITNEITVHSVNGQEVTTISGASDGGGLGPAAIRGVFARGGGSLVGFTVANGATMASGSSRYDGFGGGVWLGANCTASNLVVRDNMGDCGGGVYFHYNGTLNNSMVSSNTAACGGGVDIYEGGTLNNVLLVDNTASLQGGGAELNDGGTLNNCTLSGNSAVNYGGGVYFGGIGCTINNSIVYGNTSGSGNDIYEDWTATIRSTCASDGLTHGADGCMTNDPQFIDASAGNYQLQSSSPCRNTGDNAYAPTNVTPCDLSGDPRIIWDVVDMGAYEWQSVYDLSVYSSAAAGGGTLVITNGVLGSGSDITNVTVCGSTATITGQGLDWVEVTLGSSTDNYQTVFGDILIQSATVGNTLIENVFTYQREPNRPFYADASKSDDTGDGQSWATAKQTIQAAVDLALDSDVVWVTNGVYDTGSAVTPGHDLTNRVCITNAVTVRSVNGPEMTTISGASDSGGCGPAAIRGVFVSGGGSLIGFTVTNGATASAVTYYDAFGGGVWLTANCTASNLIVRDNMGYGAAGVYFYQGGTLNNSVVSSNTASFGGGVYFYEGGTLNNGLLIDNTATVQGGGGEMNGGGTLNNCTLSGNSSVTNGGGLQLNAGCTLNNCIVYGNTGGPGNDINGSGATIRNTCASDGVTPGTDGCITNDPLFADASAENYQLDNGSPCINAGDNTYAPTNATPYDLAGNPRIVCDIIDMGAYEKQTVYLLSVDSSPSSGGGTLVISNGVLGSGSDITNVIVCGSTATITGQGIDWVQVTLGASTDSYQTITGNVLIQSTTVGETLLYDVFTYLRATNIPFYADASKSDDSGDGRSWATAKKTIQAAVNLAADSDVVWVTNGVYDVGGAVTPGYALTNRVCITNAITVRSVNGPEVTTIAGASDSGGLGAAAIRGVFVSGGSLLAGFTVKNGATMASGSTRYDGFGGGVWLTANCTATNLIIQDNMGDCGGGVYFHQGGTLNNSIVSSNASACGGGVNLYQGGTLNNILLVGNTASLQGGGAEMNSAGTLNNCTLSSNSAVNIGGGVLFQGGGTFNNCIVYGNASGSGNDIYKNGSPTIRTTCASDGVTHGSDGCITNDPQFADAPAGNYQLQSSSPCINAGDNAYAPTNATPYDLAGNSRIVGISVDMGTYEYPLTLSRLDIAPTSLTYTAAYSGANPAQQSVTLSNAGPTELDYSMSVAYGAEASGWLSPESSASNLAIAAARDLSFSVDIAGLNAGTYCATGTFSSFSISNTPSPLSIELTVNKKDQVITFANPGAQVTTNVTPLTASATSGMDVTIAVESGPAVLDGNTNLTYTGAGTVVVTATQAGDSNWNPSVVTNSFAVSLTPQQIENFTPTNGSIFDATQAVTLAATASTGLPVTYTLQSGPAVMYGSDTLRFTGAGNVVFSADQVGNAIWDAVSLYHTCTVTDATLNHYVAQADQIPYPPYASWETAASNIQDAVELAVDGDTIYVSNGVYAAGGTVNSGSILTNRVKITDDITLRSVNGAAYTMIAGAPGSVTNSLGPDAVRAVYMSAGVLSGFTVSNGHTLAETDGGNGEDAGGVFLDQAGSVEDCIICNCGGLVNGGGLYLYQGGSATRLRLENNTAYYGAGACFDAGGILENSLVANNYAHVEGGGVFIWWSGECGNCTITTNEAVGDGDGFFTYDGGTSRNCIIYGNVSDDVFLKYGGQLTNTCSSYTSGSDGNINTPPLFADPQNGNYRLDWASPCISAGTDVWGATDTDLDGAPRAENGWVDMGCYQTPQSAGAGLQVNGTNHYIDVLGPNAFDFNANFTLEAWLQTTGNGGLFCKTGVNGVWQHGGKILMVREGRLEFNVYDVGEYIAGPIINDGAWHHVAAVFDADPRTLTLYVDGIEVTNAHPTSWTTEINPACCTLGGTVDLLEPLPGQLDELRFWNASRSAEQIHNSMFRSLIGSESNLAWYSRCNQLGTASLQDLTDNGHRGTLRMTGSAAVTSLYAASELPIGSSLMAQHPCIEGYWTAHPDGLSWYTNGLLLDVDSLSGSDRLLIGTDRQGGISTQQIASAMGARLERNWRIETNGTVQVDLLFNLTQAVGDGLGLVRADNCALLHRNATNEDFASVSAASSRSDVVISVSNQTLKTAEYTLGVTCAELTVNPTAYATSFHYHAEGPEPEYCVLSNSGGWGCTYSVQTEYAPGGFEWLSFSPSSQTLAAESALIVTAVFSVAELPVGVYWATNCFSAADAPGSLPQFAVQLTVLEPLYTVLAQAGEHGSIDPTGSMIVTNGDDITFVFSPDQWYSVSNIWVNGSSVGSSSNYTWMDISSDGTITVAFAAIYVTNGNIQPIPAYWLAEFGLTNDMPQAVVGDPDGDRVLTWREYVADTDPTNVLSYFHVTAVSNNSPVSIYFESSTNRLYSMDYCTNLVDESWTNIPGITPRIGTGGMDFMQDTNHAPNNSYRVNVELP